MDNAHPPIHNALWRLMAFLRIVYAHVPNSTAFVNDVVTRCILPASLERLRQNTAAFLQQRKPEDHSAVEPFIAENSVFETSVLYPTSFDDFEDSFDDALPIHASSVLRNALKLTQHESGSATGPENDRLQSRTSLAAQFLLEGVDAWMNNEREVSSEERQRMVRTCGVSPAAIDEGLKLNAYALSDFVIDVIFPMGSIVWCGLPGGQRGEMGAERRPRDWLAAVYLASVNDAGCATSATLFAENREKRMAGLPAYTVQEKCLAAAAVPTTTETPLAPASSSSNAEVIATEVEVGSEPPEDLIISEENIHHLLTTMPEVVPREILVARRKSLLDPTITAFELEHHFTTPELRGEVDRLVKEILSRSNAASSLSQLADGICWRGKKADVATIVLRSLCPALRFHFQSLPPSVVDVDAESCPGSPPAEVNGDSVRRFLSEREAVAPKVLIKQLVDTFTRAQFNEFLLSAADNGNGRPLLSRGEVAKLKTKLDCAKKICAGFFPK